MTQIVCIDAGTVCSNCEIGDIVAIHEDGVRLDGAGYAHMAVIRIKDVAKDKIITSLESKRPEITIAYRSKTNPDKWTFERPLKDDIVDEKGVWKYTDGKWYFLQEHPKYSINFPVTAGNIADLDNALVPEATKIQVVEQVAIEKVHQNQANMTEATDLNTKESK